jgi:hypothetical protein
MKTQIENFLNHRIANPTSALAIKEGSFNKFEIASAAPSKLSVFNNGEWHNITKKSEAKSFPGTTLVVENNLMLTIISNGNLIKVI